MRLFVLRFSLSLCQVLYKVYFATRFGPVCLQNCKNSSWLRFRFGNVPQRIWSNVIWASRSGCRFLSCTSMIHDVNLLRSTTKKLSRMEIRRPWNPLEFIRPSELFLIIVKVCLNCSLSFLHVSGYFSEICLFLISDKSALIRTRHFLCTQLLLIVFFSWPSSSNPIYCCA